MPPITFQFNGINPFDGVMSLAIVYGIFWLITLICVLLRLDLDPVTKLTWVIVVIFVPFFGMLLYVFLAPPIDKTKLPALRKKIDPSNHLSGTPWENDPGYTSKDQ